MQSDPSCPSCGEPLNKHLGLFGTCDKLQKLESEYKDFQNLLNGLHEMFNDANWSEGRAQELVEYGEELYNKYCVESKNV